VKVYAAIDLHSNNSVLGVVNEAGELLHERRYPNELPVIVEALQKYGKDLVGVVVESTYNWYWLVDGLQAAGYKVHLANTVAIKKYDGLKYSGDFTDAAHLAQLLRLGILPHGYICPPERRVVRDLARRERAEPRRAGEVRGGIAGHRAHDQNALEAEIDPAAALGDALAEADEQKWRGDADRAAKHRQRNRPESDRSIRHIRICLSESQFAHTARRWPARRRR